MADRSNPPRADPFAIRARELLMEQVLKHPDPGVRLLAEMTELSLDDARVVRLAMMLRARPYYRSKGLEA